ncbi:bifunctional 5,10-methylenetetrahydrofolate dehydrogenase/5,10-methenyltetrahydrofolate cyclohydrolase [Candidatus Woesearchaeota archaeon]|nr:bifunctional 5,10-methylenetetrahydrofolate dehydrogenase/5,10-methenyltetrahydrofolate cyclohydrolase [Candidatus Woesearchaeota archaeon]
MTIIFDCRQVAHAYHEQVRQRLVRLPFVPSLATLLVGHDDGSIVYRKYIEQDAKTVGVQTMRYEAHDLESILSVIREVNATSTIHGLLILNSGKSSQDITIMNAVDPLKDVEGLHHAQFGHLVQYKKHPEQNGALNYVVPATAKAVVKLLQYYQVPLEGSHVGIINHSLRVGKPLSLMLANLDATVAMCNSATPRSALIQTCQAADIVVTAVPAAGFLIQPDWIRDGAVVVDVSYPGNLTGDLYGKASYMTLPLQKDMGTIPPEHGRCGRLGLVTRAMTMMNLAYCAEWQSH